MLQSGELDDRVQPVLTQFVLLLGSRGLKRIGADQTLAISEALQARS